MVYNIALPNLHVLSSGTVGSERSSPWWVFIRRGDMRTYADRDDDRQLVPYEGRGCHIDHHNQGIPGGPGARGLHRRARAREGEQAGGGVLLPRSPLQILRGILCPDPPVQQDGDPEGDPSRHHPYPRGRHHGPPRTGLRARARDPDRHDVPYDGRRCREVLLAGKAAPRDHGEAHLDLPQADPEEGGCRGDAHILHRDRTRIAWRPLQESRHHPDRDGHGEVPSRNPVGSHQGEARAGREEGGDPCRTHILREGPGHGRPRDGLRRRDAARRREGAGQGRHRGPGGRARIEGQGGLRGIRAR